MLKIIAAIWLVAVLMYGITHLFWESTNKKVIMKRLGKALLFTTLSIGILSLLTILF